MPYWFEEFDWGSFMWNMPRELQHHRNGVDGANRHIQRVDWRMWTRQQLWRRWCLRMWEVKGMQMSWRWRFQVKLVEEGKSYGRLILFTANECNGIRFMHPTFKVPVVQWCLSRNPDTVNNKITGSLSINWVLTVLVEQWIWSITEFVVEKICVNFRDLFL